jgi:TPR repeat protein
LQHRIDELGVDVKKLELQLGIDPTYEEIWLESYAGEFEVISELSLREQADSGDPIAANDYGLYLCERNATEGLQYLIFSANKGVPHASANLGFYYLHGLGGAERNVKEALQWNQISAKQGHPEGAANLGFHFEHGLGVAKDKERAELWYIYSAIRDSHSGFSSLLSLRRLAEDMRYVKCEVTKDLH